MTISVWCQASVLCPESVPAVSCACLAQRPKTDAYMCVCVCVISDPSLEVPAKQETLEVVDRRKSEVRRRSALMLDMGVVDNIMMSSTCNTHTHTHTHKHSVSSHFMLPVTHACCQASVY